MPQVSQAIHRFLITPSLHRKYRTCHAKCIYVCRHPNSKAIQVHKRVKFKCMSEEKFKCTSECSTCTDGFSAEFTIQQYTGDRSRWARRAIFLSNVALQFFRWTMAPRDSGAASMAANLQAGLAWNCILSYELTFLFALYTNAYQDYRRIFSTFMNPAQHSGDHAWHRLKNKNDPNMSMFFVAQLAWQQCQTAFI